MKNKESSGGVRDDNPEGQGLHYVFLAGLGELNCISRVAKQEVSLPLLEQMSLGVMLRQKQLKQPRSQSA